MNNHCDEDWFGRSGVFNTENADHTWTVSEGKIEFPKKEVAALCGLPPAGDHLWRGSVPGFPV